MILNHNIYHLHIQDHATICLYALIMYSYEIKGKLRKEVVIYTQSRVALWYEAHIHLSYRRITNLQYIHILRT